MSGEMQWSAAKVLPRSEMARGGPAIIWFRISVISLFGVFLLGASLFVSLVVKLNAGESGTAVPSIVLLVAWLAVVAALGISSVAMRIQLSRELARGNTTVARSSVKAQQIDFKSQVVIRPVGEAFLSGDERRARTAIARASTRRN